MTLNDNTLNAPAHLPSHLVNKPDTEVLRVNDNPKKYLYYQRNPADVRLMLERLLSTYGDRLCGISSNQVAIVERVAFKAAAYGPVKGIRALKDVEKMYYRQASETSRAEFYLEVDQSNWEPLDEDEQEHHLLNQLCRISLDIDKGKYIVRKPDVKLWLDMVRIAGKELPDVAAILRALAVNEKESAGVLGDEDD